MTRRLILIPLLIATVLTSASAASAQDKGTVEPKPLPPLANPNDPRIGAKELFGRKVLPAAMPTRVLGFYAHGCIAGAEGLPINGDDCRSRTGGPASPCDRRPRDGPSPGSTTRPSPRTPNEGCDRAPTTRWGPGLPA